MFFLLKCGVWLAIVYAAIVYGIGPLGHLATQDTRREVTRDAAQAGQAAVGGLMGNLVAGASPNPCALHPGECLADAARLTALLESSLRSEPSDSMKPVRAERMRKLDVSAQNGAIPPAPVPMPVPDPRRQSGSMRLPSKS